MPGSVRLGIVSDIHYASAAEQARGGRYELEGIRNPVLRHAVRLYRRFFWLRAPLEQNHLLDQFLAQAQDFDYVVANGDYTCDTAAVGLSDPAACQSARECLDKLRQVFDGRLRVNYGDHELGKLSLFGGRGGMRLASWRSAQSELGLEPFWQLALGKYRLIGVVSSLVALSVLEPDTMPAERAEWQRIRNEHLEHIRQAFAELAPDAKVLLFCHDPTALPFLAREPVIAERISHVEQTIIGHLHSNLILWKSRWLAGMPTLHFLGHSARKMSSALREARHWDPFRVRLCHSLAGIELLKDGGYLAVELDPEGVEPARFRLHRLKR